MKQLPFDRPRTKFPFLKASAEFIIEIVKIVLVSLAIIIPIRFFFVQPFYVKGSSMNDAFLNGDYLIINELSIKVLQEELLRGNVIVFKYPKDPKQYFIKRVIALPNETIEIKEGGVFIYNTEHPKGFVLNETYYLKPGTKTTTNKGIFKVTLKDDEYFVMGDNRGQSLDSRIFGALNYENIIGKTWIRGFPFNRADVIGTPDYNF